jgi:3-deoxy-D-manno-octulosonic-acid transferase
VSLALALYRLGTGLLQPALPAVLRRRAEAGKEDPARLAERLGHPSAPRPEGSLVWLHGASVGESLSLLPLIDRLRRERPGFALLVTSGTTTSAELLARRLPEGVIHQYAPLDAPAVARRFLHHWRPDLAVFVESELWPNLLLTARARGTKLALLSARLSDPSLRRWGGAPASARRLLGAFVLVMAQEDDAAARLRALGARDDGRLNLKLAGDPLPADAAELARVQAAVAGRPVLVAASTHPGEEARVLDAFAEVRNGRHGPLLVLVPRHPARAPEIVALARTHPVRVARRSADEPFAEAEVYVADTLGELGLWFRTGDAVFVGGSLVPGIGGHNPLEPARLDRALASGPHVDNWRGVYDGLAAVGGVTFVDDAEALAAFWSRALRRESALCSQAEQARIFAAPRRAPSHRRRAPAGASRMKLATPRWWYRRHPPAPVTRALLRPASWLWARQTARRLSRATPCDPGVPVISVGNLTVGGSGKTPVAREILRLLREQGVDAHGLSRGYGGREPGPLRVDPSATPPPTSATSRCCWRRRRPSGSPATAPPAPAPPSKPAPGRRPRRRPPEPRPRQGPVAGVVDGETRDGEWPFGDGAVFPAGPMREPLRAGLARADAVVLLLPAAWTSRTRSCCALFGDPPVLTATLEPVAAPPAGRRWASPASPSPWKVERSLKGRRLRARDFVPLPRPRPLQRARPRGARRARLGVQRRLVTTEKDWVRLPPPGARA